MRRAMHIEKTTVLPIAIVVAIVIVALIGWLIRRHKNVYRQLERALHKLSIYEAQDTVIADSVDGHLHIDRLILTDEKALVIIFKNVSGTVFAGERLDEWAVMRSHRRFPFSNPLGPLQDRIAAVRALSPSLPVDGRVVFTDTARFPKGRPRQVVLLSELQACPEATGEGAHKDAWNELLRNVASVRAVVEPHHRKRHKR